MAASSQHRLERARKLAAALWGSAGVLVVLGAALVTVSCAAVSLRSAPAPPVNPALVERGRTLGFAEPSLARGREVFIARCAGCHALPDVQARDESEWERILPRMARKSRLTGEEAAAVRAYVLAAGWGGEPPRSAP